MNQTNEELVVLVDEQNNQIGTALKASVHTTHTPLHRGFSLFLFNSKGELLITQRAKTKKTFPGVWTNTVCGHPKPGENAVDGAKRRLEEELGVSEEELRDIKEVAPYRYRFADANGIVENEVCPILIASTDVNPQPNKEEIEALKWMKWEEFIKDIKQRPQIYSPWCREEAALISERLQR